MIPCKQCIVFPICKRKEVIKCKLLYEYFCKIDRYDFIGYNRRLIEVVEKHFERFVSGTKMQSRIIYFTEDRKKAIANQRFVNKHPLRNQLG